MSDNVLLLNRDLSSLIPFRKYQEIGKLITIFKDSTTLGIGLERLKDVKENITTTCKRLDDLKLKTSKVFTGGHACDILTNNDFEYLHLVCSDCLDMRKWKFDRLVMECSTVVCFIDECKEVLRVKYDKIVKNISYLETFLIDKNEGGK